MVMSDPDLANVDPGCDAYYRDLFRTESPGLGDEDAAEWFAMLFSAASYLMYRVPVRS